MPAIMTKTPAGDDIVILSRAEYEALAEAQEEASDITAARRALDRFEKGEETLTGEEVDALLAAPTPLAFWRKKRGLSQTALSEKVGVAQGFLSEIEAGKKTGDVATIRKLARALNIAMEDLIVNEEQILDVPMTTSAAQAKRLSVALLNERRLTKPHKEKPRGPGSSRRKSR